MRIVPIDQLKDKAITARRFGRSYRRYGCNWVVYVGELVACDQVGNCWPFRNKLEAQEYLKTHKPQFALADDEILEVE